MNPSNNSSYLNDDHTLIINSDHAGADDNLQVTSR